MRESTSRHARFAILAVCGFLLLVTAATTACAANAQTQASATTSTTQFSPPTTTTSLQTASTDTTELDISASTTEPDTLSPKAASSAVELLAEALRMFRFGISWSYEASGDLPGSTIAGQLIYARISNVTPDGSFVTFDAVQVYVGDPVEKSVSESPGSIRNDFEHLQTLPLAADAAILLDAGDVGDAPDLQQLNSTYRNRANTLVGATPLKFGQLFQDHPDTFTYGVFWMFIDEGKVTDILEPYVE